MFSFVLNFIVLKMYARCYIGMFGLIMLLHIDLGNNRPFHFCMNESPRII